MEDPTHNQSLMSHSPTIRGPRENESQAQRSKREKAAERQRRKRERDRSTAGLSGPPRQPRHQQQQQQQHQQHSSPFPGPSDQLQPDDFNSGPDLTPEEAARRDRVRAAARERQRKHRQVVKQRKMRELGLDMGNEIIPGMEEIHYRVNADGQYQQVLPHDFQQQQQHQQLLQQQAQAQAQAQGMGEMLAAVPQGQHGGQTFATTLLLSFSCAPLLKQHLLRTLQMTNEELASLEPVIADAWDQWDHQRRMHYESGPPPASSYPPPPAPPAFPAPPGDANEFRARFQRPLVTPIPFRTFGNGYATTNGNGAGSNGTGPIDSAPGDSTPGSSAEEGAGSAAPTGDVGQIDPHLSGTGADGTPK